MRTRFESEETPQHLLHAPTQASRPEERSSAPAAWHIEEDRVKSALAAARNESLRVRRFQMIFLPLLFVTTLLMGLSQGESQYTAITFYTAMAVLMPLLVLPLAFSRHRMTRRLASLDDVRAIGPLVERLIVQSNNSRHTNPVVRKALVRLLPRLQASDAHLLNSDQRRSLCRALRRPDLFGRNTELKLAILSAFQQIGGTMELEAVQETAAGHPRTQTGRRIQMAARECLPFLQARAEIEDQRQSLLRASRPQLSSGGADALLRPAAPGPAASDPQSLLRASEESTR